MKLDYRARLTSIRGSPLFAAFDVTAQSRFYAFMRTTVDLPDPLYKRVKAEAALHGMKMRDFIRRSLESSLAGGSKKTKSRHPVPVFSLAKARQHRSLSRHRSSRQPFPPGLLPGEIIRASGAISWRRAWYGPKQAVDS